MRSVPEIFTDGNSVAQSEAAKSRRDGRKSARQFNRPFGTRTVMDWFPALKRRAIVESPFGTRIFKNRALKE
jgi:hypothetical protein